MLYPMKDLLLDAQKNKYGIGAFNALSMDQVNTVITCGELLNSPLIIQIAEVHMPFMQFEELSEYLSFRIAKSPIPIALHLDHGVNFTTVLKCLHNKFSSVMFDGSSLDYEENISWSKKIVDICKPIGVTVEAELGHVGDEGMDGGEGGMANKDWFTNPNQVEDFVQRTGIDALAIAFGNVHGKYKGDPKLNFDLLEEISNKVTIPLVLHGGSGISADDFKKAISLGICKVNFFSGMEKTILESMEEDNQYPHAYGNKLLSFEKNIKAVIEQHIKIFGSNDRCQK